MATVIGKTRVEEPAAAPVRAPRRKHAGIQSHYPFWFYLPAGVVYAVLFLVPTFIAFYFSLTGGACSRRSSSASTTSGSSSTSRDCSRG